MNNANENLSLRKEAKEIIVETIQNSTSHGLPNIFRSSVKIVQIMWLVFLLGSTGLCMYMIIGSISNYLQFDVVTKIREINEFPSFFPTISICNTNMFLSDYSVEYLRTVGSEYNLSDIFNTNVYKNMSILDRQLTLYFYQLFAKINIQKLNQTQKKQLGYDIEDALISCQFSGQDCNISDFVWFEHQYFGGCYSFNTGFNSYGEKVPIKQVIKNKAFAGLNFVMFIGVPEILSPFTYGNGLVVFIHNATTPPQNVNSILTSSATYNEIGISRTVTRKLPYPYSDCKIEDNDPANFQSDLYQLMIQEGYEYTQLDCINQCYQKYLLNNCSCIDKDTRSVFKKNICSTEEEYGCLAGIYIMFSDQNFIKENCLPLCPLECNSKKYTFSLTSNELSNKEAFDFLSTKTNIQKLYYNKNFSSSVESNIVLVNIYLQQLSYTQIEEFADIEFVDLLSNIGGIAGLFLGVSVLSLVEFLEATLRILIGYKNHKNKIFNTKTAVDPIKITVQSKK